MKIRNIQCECLLLLSVLQLFGSNHGSRITRTAENSVSRRAVSVPLLSDEIDLETIDGVEQVTKLVLLKTDSLPPGDSDEKIDGRYLNSLMETLYTGLRKPFKSVSADILGIFPSFEEIQVRCERPSSREHLEKEETISIRRRSYDIGTSDATLKTSTINSSSARPDSFKALDGDQNSGDANVGNETIILENDTSFEQQYKSSMHVCRAVTSDCLSMDDLAQILPPSVATFDKALVRLCPIMLFRIMNQLCQKPRDSFIESGQETEMISSTESANGKNPDDLAGTVGLNGGKNSINLNTLQMLKNLQNSDEHGAKKPQRLHKKLKTHTTYKNNGRLNHGSLKQNGVDEQLLKIRLKLNEPSIEKVWIFSLLFVILSIVVSMGGLIVLPFVRKTTRRRILTLFEGLAVGGLAGSATLHMFPQAFGLVDENYHKYFWRIFVVFLGIYLCYLCERIIKIVKVVRSRMRQRSRASLYEVEYFYGFPSVSREVKPRPIRSVEQRFDQSGIVLGQRIERKGWGKRKIEEVEKSDTCHEWPQHRQTDTGKQNLDKLQKLASHNSERKKARKRHSGGESSRLNSKREEIDDCWTPPEKQEVPLEDEGDVFEEPTGAGGEFYLSNPTRQRLINCLKSVQSQFSPVYAVQTQNLDGASHVDDSRGSCIQRSFNQLDRNRTTEGLRANVSRNRLLESGPFLGRFLSEKRKVSTKKLLKHKEVETMLYHRNRMEELNRDEKTLERGYSQQQRLSSVKDVAAERQDQDNAARMSVDTVAWMIVFGDAVLNVIDGLSIGAAFERNILAGISISVAVMLEEVTHRLGTFAVLIRAGMSMQQSLLCTFLSACALFPGLIVGILLSDATEDATPYIFCAAGGIFLYMALVDVMKEMNRSIENAIRKDIKSTLQIFALQNVGIILAVIFLSFLALYEQAMDFEEYQIQYNQPA